MLVHRYAYGLKMCPIGFGDDVMHINAHISTTVCPFCFIFGMMLLASVHMIMV